jgi:hypothetical protein
MSNTYPNLIEITTLEDTERVYTKGPGVVVSDLTDAEKVVLERSKYYLEERRVKRNEELVKRARADFEKLRDIPNMPDDAIYILKRWTYRDEDDYDYEDYDIDE